MPDLRDIGLSSYEDRAYRSLLEVGAVSAKKLADLSGVPEGRIYDVLDSLETSGLVRVQTGRRPKQYVAVDPEIAIERVVDMRTKELSAEIDRYEAIGTELIDALSSPSGVEDRFWTTAIGTEDAMKLLFERIRAADDEIVMVADVFTPQLNVGEVGSDLLEQFVEAIDRGVTISVLVSQDLVEQLPPVIIEQARREPLGEEGFAVRMTDTLYRTFFLFDQVELCYDVINPMEGDTVVGMINLQDPTFTLELESQFREHWDRAEPYEP